MKTRKSYYGLVCVALFGYSCSSIHQIEQLPADTYRISSLNYRNGEAPTSLPNSSANFKADVEQTDTSFIIAPLTGHGKPFNIDLNEVNSIKMYRYTFDIDVLTVPFKVRPSVGGFPEQLNANFDAALYLGRRRDTYSIQRKTKEKAVKPRISGLGYGYGAFVGIGSVTMNPYVTDKRIDYEYDGFVLNGGIAGIYDAKKFNLGLAIGLDYLVDKNSAVWIYQGKPWFGVLFGINLN